MEDNKKDAPKEPENENVTENVAPEEEKTDGNANGKKKEKEKKKESAQSKELIELNKKLDELQDKYLRICAEYENYRKRSVKEKEQSYADAYADALSMLLPIADNLDRAITFATDDSDLSKGLKLLYKQFEESLAKAGIEEIPAEGMPFDPQLHNAVMHEENDAFGENTVSMVLQKGYKRQSKILRHAMVKVAN